MPLHRPSPPPRSPPSRGSNTSWLVLCYDVISYSSAQLETTNIQNQELTKSHPPVFELATIILEIIADYSSRQSLPKPLQLLIKAEQSLLANEQVLHTNKP